MRIINRKTLSLAAAAVLSMCMLPGCARSEQDNSGKISVVCTSFSEYDWTRNIVGDSGNIQLTYLLESGIDLHNYQPSTKDILTISDCDLFIYVGGESDKWVSDTLGEARNSDMKVISLMNVLGESVKEEEIKEGMQAEEDEHSDEPEYDEHVWLSVKNAELFCGSICETLSDIDPENADKYRTNFESYKAELSALDREYQDMIDSKTEKTVLFGDRFPFRYLFDDYGIDYYAAFVGCSAETEASFNTIVTLADKVDELGLDTVFVIENSDTSIAEAIIRNSKSKDQQILTLNSIQSVSSEMIKDGATYISLMEKNCETLGSVLK